MSNHVYEQSFSIELTSKLHVTDEFKQKFGMDTLGAYFGNEIEEYDVKSALEDPMKAVTLDSAEVLCALAMCNSKFFYELPERASTNNGDSVHIKEDVVRTKITFDDGVYCFKVCFVITTAYNKQLTTADVMMWLPAIVVSYGEFFIAETGDVKVTDVTKAFISPQAYCSLTTRTYFNPDTVGLLELPDRLNVTVLCRRGKNVVKVLTYYRDLYDTCLAELSKPEYRNRYYSKICDTLLTFFDYGYERLNESITDWDDDNIYINDTIVKPEDELNVSEFCNKYLNTYENFEADDKFAPLLDEDGEFRSDIVWTEELLDSVMAKFGFTKN